MKNSENNKTKNTNGGAVSNEAPPRSSSRPNSGGIRTIPRDRIGPMRRPTSMQQNIGIGGESSSNSQTSPRYRGSAGRPIPSSVGATSSSRYRMTLRQSFPFTKKDETPPNTGTYDGSANGEERHHLLYKFDSNNADSPSYATASTASTNRTDLRSIISGFGGLYLPPITMRIASLFCIISCLMFYRWVASTIDVSRDIATMQSIRDFELKQMEEGNGDVRTHVVEGRNRNYRENYAATEEGIMGGPYHPKISRNGDGSVSGIENVESAAANPKMTFGIYDGTEHEDEDEMMMFKKEQSEQEEEEEEEEEEEHDDGVIAVRNKILEKVQLKEQEHVAAAAASNGLRGSAGSDSVPQGDKLEQSLINASPAGNNINNDDPNRKSPSLPTEANPAKGPSSPPPKAKVAYVLPVYFCYSQITQSFNRDAPHNDATFHDAALLLKRSIFSQSYSYPKSDSLYDYQMVAIIERTVVRCKNENGEDGVDRAKLLRSLGYEVYIKDEPILASKIENEFLKLSVPKAGCCGAKELIKLHTYELVDYPIAVMVDFSTMVLKKLDDVFNLIIDGGSDGIVPTRMKEKDNWVRDTLFRGEELVTIDKMPNRVDAVFTRDFTTVLKDRWNTGVNLGFFVLRPSKEVFYELLTLYKTSNYSPIHGWDDKGYGPFDGSMLTKGLLTYYYHEIRPNIAVELNRCKYQNMAERPMIRINKNNVQCRDAKESKEECTDCRQTAFNDIVVANSKACRSPWNCEYHDSHADSRVCKGMHQSWFQMRKDLENNSDSKYSPSHQEEGSYYPEHQGYCHGGKKGTYIPMKLAEEAG
mmetsp:Transcript_31980/g.46877  ORF Transcript_31980/g.46877 Transcript_31980/m.46877 type:complete len:814 (-) Transcript_31980:140-2581(-)